MRKLFLLGASLIVLVMGPSSVFATTIKIATIVPQNSSWGGKIAAARTEIKERTDGRVQLKVYFGGVQGPAGKVMQKIKIGQLQGGDFTPTDFQSSMPDLNIYGLPFVFDSLEEVAYVRERMDSILAEGFAENGFVTFGFAGDFAIILSTTPITGLDDLKGRKLWLPEGDEISDIAMKRLKLVPNAKPLSDVMTGLNTGLFDVVAMPPAAAVALQWHTAVNYYTDMPVIYAMQFLAVQKKVFDRLSPEDQAIMTEVLTRVYTEINIQSPADAINAKAALDNNGVEVVEPDAAEFQKIQAVMAQNNRDMAEDGMFSLELLEMMEALILEYRNGLQGSAVEENETAVAADGSQ